MDTPYSLHALWSAPGKATVLQGCLPHGGPFLSHIAAPAAHDPHHYTTTYKAHPQLPCCCITLPLGVEAGGSSWRRQREPRDSNHCCSGWARAWGPQFNPSRASSWTALLYGTNLQYNMHRLCIKPFLTCFLPFCTCYQYCLY